MRNKSCPYKNRCLDYCEDCEWSKLIKDTVKEFGEKPKSYIVGNCCVVDDDVDKIYKKINEIETEVCGD